MINHTAESCKHEEFDNRPTTTQESSNSMINITSQAVGDLMAGAGKTPPEIQAFSTGGLVG